MQLTRLSPKDRRDFRWTKKRNAIVCKLLAKDATLTRFAALRKANEMMRGK